VNMNAAIAYGRMMADRIPTAHGSAAAA